MIGIPVENREGMKGAFLRPGVIPQEFLLLPSRIRLFPFKAFHVLALPADNGDVHARVHVVALDTNRRFLRVYDASMEEGANHFAQAAPAAFFLVYFDSHPSTQTSHKPVCQGIFPGIPFLSQP
jgi:hypothetical protein